MQNLENSLIYVICLVVVIKVLLTTIILWREDENLCNHFSSVKKDDNEYKPITNKEEYYIN